MSEEEIVCLLHHKKHVFGPECWKVMRDYLFQRIDTESDRDRRFYAGVK